MITRDNPSTVNAGIDFRRMQEKCKRFILNLFRLMRLPCGYCSLNLNQNGNPVPPLTLHNPAVLNVTFNILLRTFMVVFMQSCCVSLSDETGHRTQLHIAIPAAEAREKSRDLVFVFFADPAHKKRSVYSHRVRYQKLQFRRFVGFAHAVLAECHFARIFCL